MLRVLPVMLRAVAASSKKFWGHDLSLYFLGWWLKTDTFVKHENSPPTLTLPPLGGGNIMMMGLDPTPRWGREYDDEEYWRN